MSSYLKKKAVAAALIFYIALCVFIASGRLDSYDALAQLQAATTLVDTDSPGLKEPPRRTAHLWVSSPSGLWYEAHDIGATLFLAPAAALGGRLAGGTPEERLQTPPAVSRVLAALSYAILGGVSAWLLLLLLSQAFSPRMALGLSFLYAAGTPFLAYAKSSWDVLGGCAGVTLMAAACLAALRAMEKTRTTERTATPGPVLWFGALSALGLGIAGNFRFSVFPFLLPGLLAVWFRLLLPRFPDLREGKMALAPAALWSATLLAALSPTIWLNAVRSGGDALRSGTTGEYTASDALQGSLLHGLYGHLISPNRGLFPFAPIMLLLLALPFVWRRVEPPVRWLIGWMGAGTVAYLFAIAKMQNWSGNAGWGPRYLVPVLPILFLGVAAAFHQIWLQPRLRPALVGLAAASCLVNLPALIVNHTLAAHMIPAAYDPEAPFPAQQIAAWKALGLGLSGQPLPVPVPDANAVRQLGRYFPDFWTVYMMRHLPTRWAGIVLGVLLAAVLAWASVRLQHTWGLPSAAAGNEAPAPDALPSTPQ